MGFRIWISCSCELVFMPYFLQIVFDVKASASLHVLQLLLGVSTSFRAL